MHDADHQLETDDEPDRHKELGTPVKRKPLEIRDAGGLEADADAMGVKALRYDRVEKPE